MKILHTADWHLGQKFLHHIRDEEHRLALDWLLGIILEEKIELLIVAGDIFDTANPTNSARELYYNFLVQLKGSCCENIVIIGGNHDSPSMLNAPKFVLKALNVHVVGCATGDIEDEIIEIKNKKDQLQAVVAAVPFLRDRDLRSSVSGESGQERIDKIKAGIYKHYEEIGKAISHYESENVPILATGHLYATGAVTSGKQDNIYIGNMDNISAEEFPEIFDYVALGHIHRQQFVGKLPHVRYSGSLIPLSFSELDDQKVVKILNFTDRKHKIQMIEVPEFRRLLCIKGDFETVKKNLENLPDTPDFESWLEVIVETDQLIPNLSTTLRDLVLDKNVDILKVRAMTEYQALDTDEYLTDLDDLSPLEVFKKKCESNGRPPEDMQELENSFKELLNWMGEEEGLT